ncbi:hypothetical protein SERLA73DRAFT_159202 [Serpula lacrymans var. lacrymans S7.3]|uniref:Uncharacterized protein n=2 Tax=Serpula lacrymans var. lacrymans TaxID=341189 RepID=F8PQ83_SERL3|nr:uncharacterized protein SERLADRAFT_414063 [Serpula lacrymans var. lacrymans S7.9]EGO02184.1 hypothetical protein SERLA73DRAFT_159202 [Serpula lacrymans var. lacrymans S7.3]EGO27807.1 hypothetical protein SERLADRAFT_414063 [Serpula lacrymans var. lacrymans S7.9]
MSFRSRNSYYLRISASTVLPVYLYLDDRHIQWMSDMVLQHVLEDLRPLVLPKLQAEQEVLFGSGSSANHKKGTVDVHRGESYQFAYFFRKTEPHSVVIKAIKLIVIQTRTFVAAPVSSVQQHIPPQAPLPKSRSGKRKGSTKENGTGSSNNGRKKRKTKGKSRARSEEEEEALNMSDMHSDDEVSHFTSAPRRSQRARKVVAGRYQEDDEDQEIQSINVPDSGEEDIDMEPPMGDVPLGKHPDTCLDGNLLAMEEVDSARATVKQEDRDIPLANPSTEDQFPTSDDVEIVGQTELPAPEIELEVEEEEKKPKPLLRLKYQGFNILGHCLCIVVEPWPAIRSATRAPSIAPLSLGATALRGPSIAPPDFVPSRQGGALQRERTPLFLPDLDDRDRSATPAPLSLWQEKVRPPVPLFNESAPGDSDDDGYSSDGLMNFSQMLNATGDSHAAAADEEEDMDGAILFGDADEFREFS